MWLIVLEALAALAILVLAVWWTMFSGRRRGERAPADEPPRDDAQPNADGGQGDSGASDRRR
ncbi:hypothetical protein [Rubrivivax albus]|uniref:hypothetical protein n=1 Tax=Rubrivivax albus TaxID=2499835 RepID=UPI0018EE6685|nr:hypothetical protein [Rubrivivax albus]